MDLNPFRLCEFLEIYSRPPIGVSGGGSPQYTSPPPHTLACLGRAWGRRRGGGGKIVMRRGGGEGKKVRRRGGEGGKSVRESGRGGGKRVGKR